MKLGLGLDLYASAGMVVPLDIVQQAEALGFDSVWTAEAYGSDAITPLAYLAGHTERIRLGTSVIQLAARTPAAVAMAMGTVDQLAGGGRAIIGIGLSGPQIVEGWYGQPWGKPNQRLRDYITIIKKVLARDEPVTHDGPEIALPYVGPGSIGAGKPLKSILHTQPLPIYIAAGGPMNVALAAEICDGWIPMGFGPGMYDVYKPSLEAGTARRDDHRRLDQLDIVGQCSVRITDDVAGLLAMMKPRTALYVGGMGSKTHNFHRDAMARRGYEEEAYKIQELVLAGRRDEATEVVPDEYLDDGGLFGSPQRISERYEAYASSGATTLTIRADQPEALELMADLAGTRDQLAARLADHGSSACGAGCSH